MSFRVVPRVAARAAVFCFVFLLLALGAGAVGAQSSSPSDAPAKVGIIDVQRLLFDSKVGKEALGELSNLRDQKRAEAETQQKEIEDLRSRLAEGRLSLSEEKLDELQKSLEQKVIDFRRFQDDAERELQEGQEEAFSVLERQVMPIIAQVGLEFGYTAIFNKFQSGLLFALDEADLTDLILQRFDQAGGQEE
jgi:Skp family chaperone for outer membrane proteins